MESDQLQRLRTALSAERASADVLPRPEETFAAFEACAFDDVRVVILGQDPYPTPGHAMGLAFSVRPGVPPPGSLRNIYQELESDVGVPPAPHGCLRAWAEQGVFLLNSVLTVRAAEAASHSSLGWEALTDAAIRALSERRTGLVFLLWGKAAQAKARLVDETSHSVLCAPHPSPLSARRGFFGCRHFSRANDHLLARGAPPIEWTLP
ncbi:DNA-deoxyinosine glycosylase, partial [Emiliania huxleyi CCMP1516]|uniref:Uracil-DNA glycosylase n=3 Tax=Emiliania huxleyi TaxID=2903 RepID=A0A0D3K8Z0_EMIH1